MVEVSLREDSNGYILRLTDMTTYKEPTFIEVVLDRKTCKDVIGMASTLADRLIGCVSDLRRLIIDFGLSRGGSTDL